MSSRYEDQTRTCVDCDGSFSWNVEDQDFFKEKGYEPPKRCKPCREARKAQRAARGQKGGPERGGMS